MSEIKSICIFCGSHIGADPLYTESAYKTGKILAKKNINIVYGGGSVGLMGMVAKGALENGGRVTGVITEKLRDMEVGHTGLTEMKVTSSMHERKAMMNELSDAFMVLPGGIGTLEETFEMFTWFQLGDIVKPIGILNVLNYYSRLIEFLSHTVDEGFLRKEHLDFLLVDDDPGVLIDKILRSSPEPLGKWFDREKNLIK